MSVPAARSPDPLSRPAGHLWWILLLAGLILHGTAALRRIERVDALTNFPTWSVDAPERDVASPTGWEKGQRRVIVPGHHHASFRWISEAQQSAAEGRLRWRAPAGDAASEAGELRRTSLYRWWLIFVGRLHRGFSDEPLGRAIERGARWADPLLFGLLLLGGGLYSARFIGRLAASGFVIGAIALFPLAANFQPGAPDPHSLAWVLALGGVLPLLTRADRAGGRRIVPFAAAGVGGGLGFWNDAATQAPLLLAVGLGALGYEVMRSRAPAAARFAPAPWRIWAAAGAATTLAASAFEFAPDAFSWSLDAVHPLHAVAWWGVGEFLVAAGARGLAGRGVVDRRSRVRLALASVALGAWPVTAILSGTGGLTAPDFYALELANHPHGGIAANLGRWLESGGSAAAKGATLLPCGLLIIALARLVFGRTGPEERARLVLVTVATLGLVLLAFAQLRWWNLVDVLLLAVMTALFAEAAADGAGMRMRLAVATVLVLPGLFVGFPPAVTGDRLADISPPEAQALIARDFAYWLRQREGAEPSVLFSTPVLSEAVAFYGGVGVIASAEGDNAEGNLAAARIASASTEQEISVLLRSRGITHLALPLWDPVLDQLVRIGRSLGPDEPLPQDAFAVALRWWEVPLWIRPMDYLIPNQPGFQGYELRVFGLTAEQPADLGLSRLADFFVERGQLQEAQSIGEALEAYPRSVAALGATANIALALRDRARLEEALETLIPYLSRRAARDLPPDRRISLASLLLQTRRVELARNQLAACFEELDAATLRALTPGAVVNLVMLSRSLELPFPNDELRTLALDLIPPSVRSGLSGP